MFRHYPTSYNVSNTRREVITCVMPVRAHYNLLSCSVPCSSYNASSTRDVITYPSTCCQHRRSHSSCSLPASSTSWYYHCECSVLCICITPNYYLLFYGSECNAECYVTLSIIMISNTGMAGALCNVHVEVLRLQVMMGKT